MMGALAFTSPLLLLALALLPVIWWLLRLMPPRPEQEVFPPFRILLMLGRHEETPATTPWWLMLLRLLLAATLIIALSGPVLNPQTAAITGEGPLAIIFDNGWATAQSFERRRQTAEKLIADAGAADRPVSIVFTADESHDAAPRRADEALKILLAAGPRPQHDRRAEAIKALSEALAGNPPGTLAFITDGIAGKDDAAFSRAMTDLGAPQRVLIGRGNPDAMALTSAVNAASDMTLSAVRLETNAAATVSVSARDVQGRIIGATRLEFAPGSAKAEARIEAPFELRNDYARLGIDGLESAGAVRLLDDSFKRRSVGLVSGEAGDRSQPLLSPLYYISRALSPFANLANAASSDFASEIPAMTGKHPSVIVLADVGRLPTVSETALADWVEAGGTLVRFAGPRLAAAPAGDPLIPVRLRAGERTLGGAMSWAEPQPLEKFPAASPFAGLSEPADVRVSRQVLAEPSPELESLTWASLRDGTPLVTARKRGAGRIVLFHVSAESSWSNLPLSGEFVEMLRRIVQLSHNGAANADATGKAVLAPYRLLTASGALTNEKGLAKPIVAGETTMVSPANPPGLYGSEDGFEALNLMTNASTIEPIRLDGGLPFAESGFIGDASLSLKPWFLTAAMVLAIADTFVMLLIGGAFSRRPSAVLPLLLLVLGFGLMMAAPAMADDSRPGDDVLMARLDKTHLAYVITGEDEVDRISARGLAGLTDYLYYRTTLEPGEPVGVDISKDELSVFPILYWPVTATAPMPSEQAISRIDAYMRSGGTVLFDTKDQFSVLSAAGAVTPNTERLRQILAGIDIPPLEPVQSDHVLTKSFYLLKSYPGRYAGSPLWVEAQTQTKADPSRPARAGDGVTPILVTGNDFAGAWAVDDLGAPLMPLVPPDENQREMAYRTGVNIMMYMLTGNYKADQVHVPALLERLGQ
jgi:hypothetical protein